MIRRDWMLLTLCVSFTLLLTSPLVAARPTCNNDGTCDGNETAKHCPNDCGGGGGGGGGGFLSTCDTFRDDQADGVSSDGQGDLAGNSDPGEFCDSERRVSVVIGETNGGHHLDTEKSGRELDLDFSHCAEEPCTQLENFDGSSEAVLSIENGEDVGGVHLLEDLANPGDNALVGLVIGFDTGRKNHVRLSYGRDSTVVACPDAGDPVLVTRVSATSWTLESGASDRACLSEVQDNDWNNPVAHGYFYMPFLLTVRIEE